MMGVDISKFCGKLPAPWCVARFTLYFDTQLHGILLWADIDRNGNIFLEMVLTRLCDQLTWNDSILPSLTYSTPPE